MTKELLRAHLLRHPELEAYHNEELTDVRSLEYRSPTAADIASVRYSQKSELQSVTFGIVAVVIFLAVLVFNMISGSAYGIHPTAYFSVAVLVLVFAVLLFHGLRLRKGPQGVIRVRLVFKTGKSIVKKPGSDPFREGGQTALIRTDDPEAKLCPVSFNRSDAESLRLNEKVILTKLHTGSYKIFPIRNG